MERRFSSLRARGPDGAQRGILLRLLRPSRRARGRLQVRLSVSGPMEPVAGKTSRDAVERSAAVGLHYVSGKPRSGFQFTPRTADPPTDASRTVPGDDRPAVARAGNAHAVSGAGIRRQHAVLILCRSSRGAGPAGSQRAEGIPFSI